MGSPAQFHDAVDTMDTGGGHEVREEEVHDDTMGGLEDVHQPSHYDNGNSNPERRHVQSQSADYPPSGHVYSTSPTPDNDPSAQYPTPPAGYAPSSISRPNSGLSGNSAYGNVQSTYQDQNSRGLPLREGIKPVTRTAW